jgi:DNA-binding NarL/FixJ family response regulator
MSRPRTALLADSQPTFRAGVAAALRRARIDVVSEVSTAPAAVEAALSLRPALCVLDADLPGGVIPAIKRITERSPETCVVVLAAAANTEQLVAAVRAGAVGYLPRSTSASGLARAAEAVLAGSAAIPRTGVGALLREVREDRRQRTSIGGEGVTLTGREAAVVELVRDGLDTREIAAELGLSPVTVRRHLGTVAGKVGARGRSELVRTVRAGA